MSIIMSDTINGNPTDLQEEQIAKYDNVFYLFIDEGGTMRATGEQKNAARYKKYIAVFEGATISIGGYPALEDYPLAIHGSLMAGNSHSTDYIINGVMYGMGDDPNTIKVPDDVLPLIEAYNALRS